MGSAGLSGEEGTCEAFTALKPPTAEQAEALAARLTLAGKPLAPPRFHKVGWKDGQRFAERDDPDRMREPWTAPPFLFSKDPRRQRAKVTVEDIPMPTKVGAGSVARVVRGVVDEEDCAQLIAAANTKGFTPALLNIGFGLQVLDQIGRDGHRAIVDSPELTDWLFQVLEPYLPAEAGGRRLLDLNEGAASCATPQARSLPRTSTVATRGRLATGTRGRPRGSPSSCTCTTCWRSAVAPRPSTSIGAARRTCRTSPGPGTCCSSRRTCFTWARCSPAA